MHRVNKPETAFKHQIMQTVFTYQSRRSIMHYPVVLSNKVLPEQTAKQINHWSKAISQVLPCTRTWWKLRFQSTKWKIDEFVLLTFIYIIHLCLYHKLIPVPCDPFKNSFVSYIFQNDFQCYLQTIFVLATNTPSSYINSQGSLRAE